VIITSTPDEFVKKIAKNVAQPTFGQKIYAYTVVKSSPKNFDTSVIFQKPSIETRFARLYVFKPKIQIWVHCRGP
jgi:hypothetical protein